MNTRYILFGITIVLGLVAGLYFGWELRPVSAADAEPALLREDFAADYTLMVAENYAADTNLERAISYLEFLNLENPLLPVIAALEFAQEHSFASADVSLLAALAADLRAELPSLVTPTP